MTKEVRLRTGSSNDHINFTGAASEITVDSDKKIVVVHDGNKQGGYELVGVGVTQTLTNKTIIVGESTITGTVS